MNELRALLEPHGQEQLLRFWDELDGAQRLQLAADVAEIDLDLVDGLVSTLLESGPAQPDPGTIEAPEVVLPSAEDAEAGREMLAAGEVAVVIVAGGQGTRLGFDGPKGCYPVGPVTDRSLFQIHAEKVVALGRRHGVRVPLYVMTSPQNQAETAAFFAQHDSFGVERLTLFVQGEMPAVDRTTGKILLAERGQVALSPDGHGGTIRALERSGALAEMAGSGITTIFYLQVDNPLVAIGDAGFLGAHRRAGAEMSSKVVRKTDPAEKVGLVVMRDGRQEMIEYSDLPDELAGRRAPGGGLDLWAGSIALHLIDLGFAARLAEGGGRLPFHRAVKPVPYVDESGRLVDPDAPNAVKFEQFIFDALPLADRSLVVETDRDTEFEPLKNAAGPASPETVRARLSAVYAGWLEAAGVAVPRGTDGLPAYPIEISPLVSLDGADLPERVDPGMDVAGPVVIS
ncbi:MAG TPA: UTP--glucose-1-phosphate uridylyltransferase [Gaiellales bacterium]|nr:UTP--glucose-1-phosphate uridylyltransferase [Gaiellales bacterium]